MALKQVTFDLFLSSLQFTLSCYQLVVWLHCKLVQMQEDISAAPLQGSNYGRQNQSAGATLPATVGPLSGCLQTFPPGHVELHKVKQWLQRYTTPTVQSSQFLIMHVLCDRDSQHSPQSQRQSLLTLPGNKQTGSTGAKLDRWTSRRSCGYHMHECVLNDPSSPTHSALSLSSKSHNSQNGGVGLCGISFSDTETRQLTRLLAGTVDGLLDSGGSNVSTRVIRFRNQGS
jgi:hypothetical protein